MKPFRSRAIAGARAETLRELKPLFDALKTYGRDKTPTGKQSITLMKAINRTINGLSKVHDRLKARMDDPKKEFTSVALREARAAALPYLRRLMDDVKGKTSDRKSPKAE